MKAFQVIGERVSERWFKCPYYDDVEFLIKDTSQDIAFDVAVRKTHDKLIKMWKEEWCRASGGKEGKDGKWSNWKEAEKEYVDNQLNIDRRYNMEAKSMNAHLAIKGWRGKGVLKSIGKSHVDDCFFQANSCQIKNKSFLKNLKPGTVIKIYKSEAPGNAWFFEIEKIQDNTLIFLEDTKSIREASLTILEKRDNVSIPETYNGLFVLQKTIPAEFDIKSVKATLQGDIAFKSFVTEKMLGLEHNEYIESESVNPTSLKASSG